MVSVSERVAFLEGQTGELITGMDGVRATVTHLGQTVAHLGQEVADLRGDVKELRRDMDRRFERLEDRFDRRFTWLVGTQVAIILAVIGALAAPYFQ